jgi:hypothetical protein
MMRGKLLILFLIILGLGVAIQSQPCKNYLKKKKCGPLHPSDFRMSGQSKSAMFELKSKSNHEMILYGKTDYKVICCTDKRYYPIHFKITEKQSGDVIYDNMDDNYNESIGFTTENTQVVIIEVELLSKDFEPSDFSKNRACGGLLVLWRKTPKLGF